MKAKSAVQVKGMQIETKDVHVTITKSEMNEAKEAMKPQTAWRGRVHSGPANNGKTLHDLKIKLDDSVTVWNILR